jgi:hypothetical protein
MARKEKGMRLRSGNWTLTIRVNGQLYTTTMPGETPIETRRQWLRDQRTANAPPPAPPGGSLWDDIQQHLARPRIANLPTIGQRAAHLTLWATALGRERTRDSIQPREIEAIAEDWRSTPTNQPDPARRGRRGRPSAPTGLGPSTVRKRLRHLSLFFKERNGEAGANPVRGLLKAHREPKAEARSIDYAIIEQALALMPATRIEGSRQGPQRLVVNLAPIRARVIAYTGIPPALLMQLQPRDLVLTAPGRVRVPPRKKGDGVEARTLKLAPQGLAAFQAFHAANAYGRFATSALNMSLKRALRRAGVTTSLHLYDLRHSWLTEVYRVTRDEATVGRLGLHAEGSPMTARYTRGAHDDVDAAAVEAVGAALIGRQREQIKPVPTAPIMVQNQSQQLSRRVVKANKPSQEKTLREVS